jgi:LPXTG-site transpeptidase (sortase) family protein
MNDLGTTDLNNLESVLDAPHSRREALKYGLGVVVGAAALTAFGESASAAKARRPAPISSIQIPRLRLSKPVYEGTATPVLNLGGGAHWTGTVMPGTAGNSVIFGHRTSAGGPFRKINVLHNGDIIVVGGIAYTIVQSVIVGANQAGTVVGWDTGGSAGITLVACTKLNGLPTSTAYRYLVRALAL